MLPSSTWKHTGLCWEQNIISDRGTIQKFILKLHCLMSLPESTQAPVKMFQASLWVRSAQAHHWWTPPEFAWPTCNTQVYEWWSLIVGFWVVQAVLALGLVELTLWWLTPSSFSVRCAGMRVSNVYCQLGNLRCWQKTGQRKALALSLGCWLADCCNSVISGNCPAFTPKSCPPMCNGSHSVL